MPFNAAPRQLDQKKLANACRTFPLFLTTAEFLPEHHRQLAATRQLIAEAETGGQARMAQMNRAVETSLTAIIGALERPDYHNGRNPARCGCGDPGHAS